MNKRALIYLGLASGTLATAYLYVQSLQSSIEPSTAQQTEAAQALESLSIVNGHLTTGSFTTQVQQGQRVQFLVHSNQTDSLIVEGLDTRILLPGNKTTLVSITANTTGTYPIELDLSGTVIGTIEVTGN